MVKRCLAAFLVVFVLISLIACKKNKETNKTPEGPKTTLELLQSAGEKLRNVQSFQLDIWHWTANVAPEEAEVFTPDSKAAWKLYEMQYVSDQDGEPASYLKVWSVRKDEVKEWHCLGDKVGYGGQDFEKGDNNYKHFSENGFTAKQRFWILGLALDIEKDTLFEEFCQLEPTVTTAEDGTTTMSAWMNTKQLQKLLNVEKPMNTAHELELGSRFGANSLFVPSEEEVLTLEFAVNAEGHLSHIGVKRWYCAEGSTEYQMLTARMISFSKVNEKIELDTSNISENYLKNPDQDHYFIHHYQDGYQAIYDYDTKSGVYNYNHLRNSMEKNMQAYNPEVGVYLPYYDMTIPAYRLLTEIDGRPVGTEYTLDTFLGSGYAAEMLIIPKGMTFNYGYSIGLDGAYRQVDKVFFEDGEQNAKIAVTRIFYTPDSNDSQRTELTLAEAEALWGEIPNAEVLDKIYYAGQWEYVNGVPTPVQ